MNKKVLTLCAGLFLAGGMNAFAALTSATAFETGKAYVLSDGFDGPNINKGNDENVTMAPEFSFDLSTVPMLFIHGDADVYSAMGSVKVWEKMRSMGIQSELHTLALRNHCFQSKASPGTGSYTWLDRIVDFLRDQKRLGYD